MSGNEHQEGLPQFAGQGNSNVPPAANSDATNPIVHPSALVTVPDPNGSKQVTVTLATHQVMASAGNYSFKSVDFNNPQAVVAHVKKVREFLKTQSKIVGADSIKDVIKPFLKSVLRGTVYKSSFSFLWNEVGGDWGSFLDKMVSEVGQLASNEHLNLALELLDYVPPRGSNLRMSVLHFAGKIHSLAYKQVNYVPHQAILSNRLLKFVPVNVQHYMDAELRDPCGGLSLDEYVSKLREFALLIHPKTMPQSITPPTSTNSQSNSNKNSQSSSNNRGNGRGGDGKGSGNQSGGQSQAQKSSHSSSGSGNNQKPSSGSASSTQNAATNSSPTANNSTNYKANKSSNYSSNYSTNRPPPISLGPPVTRPPVPQPVSGDISMSGNAKQSSSVAAGSSAPLGQLGRLQVSEEQEEYTIWARVDSGADDHIAGKDVLGHGIPAGRHESLFSVPLQRKAIAADCVVVEATTEFDDVIKFRGVVSPSTSTCLRPSALCYDSANPDPSSDYAIVNGLRLPVHVRNNSPYVKLKLSPAHSKSKRDFCSMMGFASNPLPTDAELAMLLHVKFACAGAHSIDLTCRILGYPLLYDTIRQVIATCRRCPQTDTFGQVQSVVQVANALEHVSPAQDVLVFDGAEWPDVSERGNRSFLVAKLVRCGRYFIRPGGRSTMADSIIKIIKALHIPVVACFSDRSSDFNRVRMYCHGNNIQYVDSLPGRDEFKGYQESAVFHAKSVIEWCVRNWDHNKADKWWDVSCYAAEHFLNTRASPSRLLIPFHVCHNTRPRYDLFPLSVVTWVKDHKLLKEDRTELVVFLCQVDVQTAKVWRFDKCAKEVKDVHISSLRSNKFNLSNIDAYLKPLPSLNALSKTARPVLPHEKRTKEWTDAILLHADKLVNLGFAKQPTNKPPQDVVRSFFVGRNMDGVLNARLVANGGLSIDGQVLDQYLPSLSERFSFLCLLSQKVAANYVPWSGDISGAYYSTKGEGFIRLPTNWPDGVGGFKPNQIVELCCAIPGDRLSSGLFLHQLDSLLTNNGFEILSGRTKRFQHKDGTYSYILNYSDDLLGFSPSIDHLKEVESILQKGYNVSLDPGLPPKWVGMDLETDQNGVISACSASTFLAYDVHPSRFSLEHLNKLQLTEKCNDKQLIKVSLSAIGKLLYGATTNPWLTYLSSFLASALHYDPIGAKDIALSAIYYYAKHPAKLFFSPIEPKY